LYAVNIRKYKILDVNFPAATSAFLMNNKPTFFQHQGVNYKFPITTL